MKFKAMLENKRNSSCLIMVNVKIKKEEISGIFGNEFLIDLMMEEKKNFNYLPNYEKSSESLEQINKLTKLIQTKVNNIVCKEYEYDWKLCGYCYGKNFYGKNFEVFW